MFGIAPGQVQPAGALAARMGDEGDAPAGALLQSLGQQRGVRQFVADQQFGGNLPVQIVLSQKGAEHRAGILVLGQVRKERLVAQQPSAAKHENLHAGRTAVRDSGHHVEIAAFTLDVLALLNLAQFRDLIAINRRLLEMQRRRRRFHALRPFIDHLSAPAFQKQNCVLQLAPVAFPVDQTDAGRGTTPDLILQAGPTPGAEKTVLARAQPEHFLEEVQRIADGVGVRIGTEVASGRAPGAAMQRQAGKIAIGHVDVGITLVIAQQDVVARLEFLDQPAFQDQRLGLGMRDCDLDGLDLGDQAARPGGGLVLSKVTRHPPPQIAGLADVKHYATLVQHSVNAGQGDESFQERLELKRRCHACVGLPTQVH